LKTGKYFVYIGRLNDKVDQMLSEYLNTNFNKENL